MNRVTFPLNESMQGPDVKNLQEALLKLIELEAILTRNRSVQSLIPRVKRESHLQSYGEATTQMVRFFQREQQLQPSLEYGYVDEITATALNQLLIENGLLDDDAEQEVFSVSGQVVDADDNAMYDVTVRAYDKLLRKEQELGDTSTEVDGQYLIDYQADQLINPERKQANLLVKVFSDGELIISSPLILNALAQENVNLKAGKEAYQGPDLFSQLVQQTDEYLRNVDLNEIEPSDIYTLANMLDRPVEMLHHFILARLWSGRGEDIPARVYFAWLRTGLPSHWGDLLARSLDELKNSIEQAVSENIVNKGTLQSLEKLEQSLKEWRSQYVLTEDDQPLTQASLKQLLESSALDTNQRAGLIDQWQTFSGTASEFWTQQREQLGDEISEDLDLTLQLGVLTRNHLPLVKVLKNHPNVSRFNDVARFSRQEWQSLIKQQQLEMPEDIIGDDPDSQRVLYADAMADFTEQLMPTRVLTEALSRDDAIDSQDMDSFFSKNPKFEFRRQTVKQYINDHPDALAGFSDSKAVQSELEAMQRVFHLSPAKNRYAAAKVLWKNKLHTPWSITLRGGDAFEKLFPAGLKPISQKIYQNAQNLQKHIVAASLLDYDIYSNMSKALVPERDETTLPDLQGLFGAHGYCECKHCLSIFSPSAYLVDLLLYLERAGVQKKLLERRPDIASIELDCENSHTPLPYIDLVNEVLENAIDPPQASSNLSYPQTERDADTLKALPQHLNPDVYDKHLKQAVYPWNLPFNLWATEVRTYLQHLQIPRWQLMDSVLVDNTDLAIASEYLGLLPEEKTILINDEPSHDDLEKYWNIGGTINKIKQELASVPTLMQKSELNYQGVRELFNLRYIQYARFEEPEDKQLKIIFEPASSCQIEHAKIDNLNKEALVRLQRFCRLLRKTSDKPVDLDQSILLLDDKVNSDINSDFLIRYSNLLRIEQMLPGKITRTELLSWWNVLDTHAYPQQASFYETLFLRPDISPEIREEFELNDSKDELKKADGNSTTELDLNHPDTQSELLTHLLGTLRWKQTELNAVVQDAWTNLNLKLILANLSYLYRVSSFCRSLRITVPDYLRLTALLGAAPLLKADQGDETKPQHSRVWLEHYFLIRKIGLDPETLDYLLRHRFRADSPIALGRDQIGQILFDLQTHLNKQLNQTESEEITLEEIVQAKLTLLLSPEDMLTARQILEADSELILTLEQQKDFIAEKLLFFPDTNQAQTELLESANDIHKRYQYVLEYLIPYLNDHAIVQQLAEAINIDHVLVAKLLTVHLQNPLDSSKAAIRLFYQQDYLEHDWLNPNKEMDLIAAVKIFSNQANILVLLHKIGMLMDKLELTTAELVNIFNYAAEFNLPNLARLPMQPEGSFDNWLAMFHWVHIKQDFFRGNNSPFNLLAYIAADVSEHNKDDLLEALSTATSWEFEELSYLCGSQVMNLVDLDAFRSLDWLVNISTVMPLVQRAGVQAKLVAQWLEPNITQQQALSLQHALKAKYGDEQWLEIIAPLRNTIREQQRDALLNFVLHHRSKYQGSPDSKPFEDVDDLYGHYLIDPQMSACAQTSRTVLASSSIQLFVQRIWMNLEPGVELSRKYAKEWKWRKYYRVWEANRKVLLWPENWIEPELRDDKSPFFKELENELLQDQLNDETVERAYVNYLYKLNDVARLDICGVHYEEENRTLHVFGRTTGEPSTYYYRRWENRQNWTAWEKVELDIHNSEGVEEPQSGVLLLPVVHNQRLFLFWPIFTLKQDELSQKDKKAINFLETLIRQGSDTSSNNTMRNWIEKISKSYFFYNIKLGFAHYRQGRWSEKKITNGGFKSPYISDVENILQDLDNKFYINGAKDIGWYYLAPTVNEKNNELRIECHINGYDKKNYKFESYFLYDSCLNVFKVIDSGRKYKLLDRGPNNLVSYMKLVNYNSYSLWFTKTSDRVPMRVVNFSDEQDILLNKAERWHRLSVSMNRNLFKQDTPFIYEDKKHTFLVIPPEPLNQYFFPGRIGNISANVLAGKTRQLSNPVFNKILIPPPKPINITEKVLPISNQTVVNTYFNSDGADKIIARSSKSGQGGYSLSESSVIAVSHQGRELSEQQGSSANMLGTVYGLLNQGDYFFRTFYHPYVCLFIKQLNRYGINGLLDPDPVTADGKKLSRQATPNAQNDFNFDDLYDPDWQEVNILDYPREIITFNYDDPYASYNWELFFHIPLLIATRLYQDQRFESAQTWFHYIFDPTETEGEKPYRYWKIKPFHAYGANQMQADLDALLKGKNKTQIQAWRDDPFNPHLLARFRRLAYMKTTVMKYLDNLIAWGDQLFRRDSIESINEATQLYVLAGQILGKLPVATEAKPREVKTYHDLAGQLDSLGNAWLDYDLDPQAMDVEDNVVLGQSSDNLDSLPFFCFPPNEKLLAYWDTVADRLFKIRHCMNIEGMTRQLPLFQPPIDPALLVRAAASGMDLSSVLNDLFAPLPHYRFSVMVQKAQELCQELKSLGGSLLSALEKEDAEALAQMRADQEVLLLEANKEIRAHQINEAMHNLEALEESKELADIRYKNYFNREYINDGESAAIGLSIGATVFQAASGLMSTNAGVTKLFPDVIFGQHAQLMASGVSSYNNFAGGSKSGSGLDSMAKAFDILALILREASNVTSTYAQYDRRQEDWDLQRDIAKQEMKQIDKQILAAEIRIAMAEKEQKNLELQIEQSRKVADFIQNKYTHKELYGWMAGQLKSVYSQTYQLAYDIAKQAEKLFRHELGIDKSSYIQFGYWDNVRKGLLSGEKLSLDLKRMEMAYLEHNRREYELTKSISLHQLNPVALLALKTTGMCEFTIPEWLFDLSTPGHYMRRIRNVSLTIPAVTGPYSGVNCTLSMVKSTLRRSALVKEDQYQRSVDAEDSRFIDFYGTTQQSIVTSSGQNDSGLFETNLRDERFLPFEGHGVESEWKLQLPNEFRQFDYNSITDVILHISYTARQGGDTLKQKAVDHIKTLLKPQDTGTEESKKEPGLIQFFSFTHDFSNEWHQFVNNEDQDFKATIKKEYFPYLVQSKTITIEKAVLYAIKDDQIFEKVISRDMSESQDESQETTLLNLQELSDKLNGDNLESEITFVEDDEVLKRNQEARVFLIFHYKIE